jgi:hypothetical protein
LNDALVKVWDVSNAKAGSTFQWFRGAARVPTYNSNVAFSTDGRKLLIGRNAEAALFDLSSWLPARD